MATDDWKARAVPNVVRRVELAELDADDYARPAREEPQQPVYLFRLSLPPSANELVRPALLGGKRARLVKTDTGRKWLAYAVRELEAQFPQRRHIVGPVYLHLTAYVARVTTDLDNRVKALSDAITAAGLWHDDAQVVRLEAEKRIAPLAIAPFVEVRVGAYWTDDSELRTRLATTKRGKR